MRQIIQPDRIKILTDKRRSALSRANDMLHLARMCMSSVQMDDDRRFSAAVSLRNACLRYIDTLTMDYHHDEECDALGDVRFRASQVALFCHDACPIVEAADILGIQKYDWEGPGSDFAEHPHAYLYANQLRQHGDHAHRHGMAGYILRSC